MTERTRQPDIDDSSRPSAAATSEAGGRATAGPSFESATNLPNIKPSPEILVVDDEQTLAHVIRGILEEHGCAVRVAHSAEEGLSLLTQMPPDVAVVDIVLPGMNGLELLARIKTISPDTEVLIMTSHASVETAVQAIRQGAYDYLQKPFDDVEDVWITVRRAFEKRDLSLRNRALLREAEVRNRDLATAVMRLTSLTEAGRAMGHCQSLPELLDFVLGLVTKELDVDRASLMLIEEGTEFLRIAACRGLGDIETDTVCVRLGEGIAGSVAKSGIPFLVTNTDNDPRVQKRLRPGLSNSFISAPIVLSLPIKSRETILGVINVTNRRSGQMFTKEDVSFLSGLAGQLAVAVEGTRHFENLKKAYESLKAAQEGIVRSERLKAIGEMAAGVAHDFNNSLSVLLGKAQTVQAKLQMQPTDYESVRGDLDTMRKVSEQAAGTIRRIQDYTRIRKDVTSAAVDLCAIVRDAVEITRPKWKEAYGGRPRRIDLRLELQDVPTISGNTHELTQVVGNMIFNAVEAMPEGGTLALRVFAENEQVILEVEDTGAGMSQETRDHLFEPFFTTKESGQGLGASIIFGIVARHRGKIEVQSDVGQGTTFRVRFPDAPAPGAPDTISSAAPAASNRAPAPAGPGPMRILLVEDEELVRETYAEAMVAQGYEISSFSNGPEALLALRSKRFNVVVTDLAMPEMSGLDLARQVKALDPALPVILLSGWAMQQDDAEVKDAGIDFVLAKPCLIETLVDTVRLATESKVTV